MKANHVLKLSFTGLLVAVGIIIPMFSPVKIILEPASFTLASHVAIFVAMSVSPGITIAVVAGTTIGFLFGGFPIVVVIRAASHLVFSFLGSMYLLKNPAITHKSTTRRLFSLFIAVVHAIFEILVVSIFYFGGLVSDAYYQSSYFMSVFLLVGIGTIIHSMVDYEIAYIIILTLGNNKIMKALSAHDKGKLS